VGAAEVGIRETRNGRWEEVWNIVTSLVLDGLSSVHTRRAYYAQALEEFLIWFRDEPGRTFNRASVQKYRTELETKGLAASSINVRLSAVRRFALEAADNGLLPPRSGSRNRSGEGRETKWCSLGPLAHRRAGGTAPGGSRSEYD
jgi:hypothetical protein